MSKIENLPNIGKVLAEKLELLEIRSAEELIEMGTENVFIQLYKLDQGDACINKLMAIEGAIQGIRWHLLDQNRKDELKEFFNTISV